MSNAAKLVAMARAHARANRSHFVNWCKVNGYEPKKANRSIIREYGRAVKAAAIVPAPLPLTKPKQGSVIITTHRPTINLTSACPTTGFVRLRCGCVRCANARKQ